IPRLEYTMGAIVASSLSEIAQKNGISVKKPLSVELPNLGKRNPVWRSRRMAAAKNGRYGIRGRSFTQKEALVPYTKSFRSAEAEPKWNDHVGESSSQVVKEPL